MIPLLVLLIVVGVALWLINTYIPMQPPFKTIINIIVILVVLVYILNYFGLLHEHLGMLQCILR